MSPDIDSLADFTFTQLLIPFHEPTLQNPDFPEL